MPYCPQCRAEYREGVGSCVHCHVTLVDRLPDRDPFASPQDMAEMLRGESLAPAFVGGPTGLAEMRNLLAQQRVPSVVAPPQEGCGTTCKPRLMILVRPDDVDRAHGIYESSFDPDHRSELVQPIDPRGEDDQAQDAPDECPACGTRRPSPDSQECPECGLFLG